MCTKFSLIIHCMQGWTCKLYRGQDRDESAQKTYYLSSITNPTSTIKYATHSKCRIVPALFQYLAYFHMQSILKETISPLAI